MGFTIHPVQITGFDLFGSVGAGGKNDPDDIQTVVTLLNGIPPTRGGALPPIDASQVTPGSLGMGRLIESIKEFQRIHFAFAPDGNIEPNKNTHKKLRFEFLNRNKPSSHAFDLLFNGRQLIWGGTLPDNVHSPLVFKATSGLTGHQVASEQTVRDAGPIPEGTYSFLAAIDPHIQATVVNPKTGDLDSREGIQVLPHGSFGWYFPGWGTYRVRLSAAGPVNAPYRGGFYLHDSHKGYSHGCVETQTIFFDHLFHYARQRTRPKQRLLLRVAYAGADTATYGDTASPTKPGEYNAPTLPPTEL